MRNLIFSGHLQAFPSTAQKSNFFSFPWKVLKCQNFWAMFRFFQLYFYLLLVLQPSLWVRTSKVVGLTMICDNPGFCWSTLFLKIARYTVFSYFLRGQERYYLEASEHSVPWAFSVVFSLRTFQAWLCCFHLMLQTFWVKAQCDSETWVWFLVTWHPSWKLTLLGSYFYKHTE